MSWRDRIRPGSYTSPSGSRISFQGTSFSRSFTKRGTVWQYADVDGQFVQQTGNSDRTYPLRMLFSGADCDLQATAMEDAIAESGFGSLDHIVYGTVSPVAPLGEVTRREDLVERGGEVVLEVEFFRTFESVYPILTRDPIAAIGGLVDFFNGAAANDFADAMGLGDAASKEMSISTIESLLTDFASVFAVASGTVGVLQANVLSRLAALNRGIDVLIGTPAALARQTAELVQSPARGVRAIGERLEGYAQIFAGSSSVFGDQLDAYGAFADSIFGGSDEPSIQPQQTPNDAFVRVLFAASSVSGAVLSAAGTEYQTRPQASRAALRVGRQWDDFVRWRDEKYGALSGFGLQALDVSSSHGALYAAVSRCLGHLVSTSFGLAIERRITLGRPRQLIELAGELYGNVDNATLDRLIRENDLTGSEILEIPKGRTIAYFEG